MKLSRTFFGFGLLTVPAFAGSNGDFNNPIVTPAPESRWSVGADFTLLTGVRAKFTGLGNWNSPNPTPSGAAGTDRNYDDGFNHVDSTGNGGGLTWNWGYNNASQYNPASGGSIAMSVYNSASTGSSKSDSGDWHPGLEVSGYYDMGAIPSFRIGGRTATWGWRVGFSWQDISVSDSDPTITSVNVVTDTFGLGGAIPASAPYAGSAGGPGALLSDSGTRSTSTGTALVLGKRNLDVDLFGLSAGPYIDLPLADKFHLRLEGGATLAAARGRYDYFSSTTIAGVGTQGSAGKDSDWGFMGGVYLGMRAEWLINRQWAVTGGVRYQYLNDYSLRAGTSKATLQFDSGVLFSLGARYTF